MFLLCCFSTLESVVTTISICWVEFSPGRFRGLENATKVYIDKVVTSKWVEFQFWVNYPFNSKFKLCWHYKKLCLTYAVR